MESPRQVWDGASGLVGGVENLQGGRKGLRVWLGVI